MTGSSRVASTSRECAPPTHPTESFALPPSVCLTAGCSRRPVFPLVPSIQLLRAFHVCAQQVLLLRAIVVRILDPLSPGQWRVAGEEGGTHGLDVHHRRADGRWGRVVTAPWWRLGERGCDSTPVICAGRPTAQQPSLILDVCAEPRIAERKSLQ